ncbi:Benzoate transport protein [Pseudomonas savastanoi]|uniref:Benzoate transport protein n=2 Tax=Pseudomonas syringae group TaxID=136849 RepID=A0A3M5FW92_PSESS|nr:Benzoate transport protein [Pseudomonas savastanoi]
MVMRLGLASFATCPLQGTPCMNETLKAPLRPLTDSSPSAVVAGFIAMMTGCTSSLVLMFQAGQAAGLSSVQISSWLWALFMGMAVCSIGLSLRYRMPITVAWSTPGAALLITGLGGVAYPQAIGAFMTSALLVILCGVTGSFERIVRRLPASLAAALLAGILFRIGSEIFIAAQHRTSLVLGMFFTYLVVKRLSPRYSVLLALLVGIGISGALGLLNFSDLALQVAMPVWTTPEFS